MASPPLHVDDLSFSDLDLITTPPAGASSNKHTRPTTRPSFKPATAGSRPSAAGGISAQSQQANLRLLQGVNKPPPMAAANRAGGGGNKRRTSLFVPSALPKANSSAADDADESAAAEQAEGEGDDSLLEAMKSSKPREPALPTLPASFHHQRPTRGANAAADEEAEGTAGEGDSETKEQVQRHLDDLSKMNSSFEAYERMLQGTVGQIDLFGNRLEATSSLLSSYIDLLRRSASHQSLLLNPSWQGQTEDKIQHAEAMRDLEEQMEKRRRQREEEEEREEQERLRREQAIEEEEYRRSMTATSAARGGRGRGTGVRGRPTTTGAGAAGRGGASTTATRGRGAPPVRGGIAGRPSGIPAPTTARGTSAAGVRGSTRGRGTTAK